MNSKKTERDRWTNLKVAVLDNCPCRSAIALLVRRNCAAKNPSFTALGLRWVIAHFRQLRSMIFVFNHPTAFWLPFVRSLQIRVNNEINFWIFPSQRNWTANGCQNVRLPLFLSLSNADIRKCLFKKVFLALRNLRQRRHLGVPGEQSCRRGEIPGVRWHFNIAIINNKKIHKNSCSRKVESSKHEKYCCDKGAISATELPVPFTGVGQSFYEVVTVDGRSSVQIPPASIVHFQSRLPLAIVEISGLASSHHNRKPWLISNHKHFLNVSIPLHNWYSSIFLISCENFH